MHTNAALYLGTTPFVLATASFLLPLLSLIVKRKQFFDLYATVFALYAAIGATKILVDVYRAGKPLLYTFGGWPPPVGVVYEVDPFSAVLGTLTAIVMIVIVVYSYWYTAYFEKSAYLYYALLLALEAGMLGCIYTGDIFNFFVMMELMCLAAYALVAFYRWKLVALEASMKYALIGTAATTIYFLAVVLLYHVYGSLNLADIAAKARGLEGLVPPATQNVYAIALASSVAVALSLWTFMYLSAIFPNHFWLPDAHPEAPAPISAALSGLVVNVGVYAYARFMYTLFDGSSVLGKCILKPFDLPVRDALMYIVALLGGITAILGAMLMSVQNDVKRLLAYSTISHMGLLFMTLSLGVSSVDEHAQKLLLESTLLHTVAHGLGKALLFLSVGVLIAVAGSRRLSEWSGVGKLSPIAAAGAIVGALNLMGVPPFIGFFSKLMLVESYIACNNLYAIMVLVVSTALAIPGYIKLVNSIAMGIPKDSYRKVVSLSSSTAIAILVATCLALGVAYIAGYVAPFLSKAIDLSMGTKGIELIIDTARSIFASASP